MGNLCSCTSAPEEEPKRQVVKPVPKPPSIQEFTFAPETGSGGLKVFPTAAYFKPGGLSSTSALRVVEQGYVFAALFDGLCGNESALACKDLCHEAFAAAIQHQKQQQEESQVDYAAALLKMFTSLDEQLIQAATKKPGMTTADGARHKNFHAVQPAVLQYTKEEQWERNVAILAFKVLGLQGFRRRPYFSSLSVLAPDLPKTQAEYALLHAVRDHVLGFGIVKDSHLASAYRPSAQGRENAARGIPGNAYPTPPDPTTQKQGPKGGAKGGAKAAAQPVVPPGRAGWPYEEAPAPEAFQGCEVQINQRDLTMYDEHIILLSPCALSMISPSDAVGLAHAYDTPHMQLMRAAVDHVPPKPANPALQSGEGAQGGENGGGEDGGGGKQSEGAVITDGGDQGKGQQPGVQQQPQPQQQQPQQQLQQPLMLSHGLGGHQASIESTGEWSGSQGRVFMREEAAGSCIKRTVLDPQHFKMTSYFPRSTITYYYWDDKARQVHNTLDEDEVLPEARAVAFPSSSSLPSRSASAAPGGSGMSSTALRGNSADAAAKLPRETHEKDPASRALPPSHLDPNDQSKATPFASVPVQCNMTDTLSPSISNDMHVIAGCNVARRVCSASNGTRAPADVDGSHAHAHAEAHVRLPNRPPPLRSVSSRASAASSPKITLPTTPTSPTSVSGHHISHPSIEVVTNPHKGSWTSKLGGAPPKRKGPPAPRIKAQQRDAAVVVLALEWPVSLTSHQANRMRVVEASRVTNPRALYRWHMVRQLVRFMRRKRVVLRTCWHQTVHAAVLEAAQARRDAEVLAWKELGMAVQLTHNNKVFRSDSLATSQQRPSNQMSALDRSSIVSSASSLSLVPQSSAISANSEFRRSSRTNKMHTMACQRPHHEPPVLLSDKWNSPAVTHQHAQPRVNTRPSSSAAGSKAPANQYAHLSASQRPGGNAAEQAKSLASAHKPPSSATAKSSAARATGRQSVGSSGDSANKNQAPSKGFHHRSEGDVSGIASAKPTPRQIGAAYDQRRRNRPSSSSDLHVDGEPPSPPAPSGTSSPTASVTRSQSFNSSGGRAPTNRYAHLSASQRPGGDAAEHAKFLASVHKPPSSATAKSSAARAVGRQGLGSSWDSAKIRRATSQVTYLHVDVEEPCSPPAHSGASSPAASFTKSQSSDNSGGHRAYSNISSRYMQSSASSKQAESMPASSGREGTQTTTSRPAQSTASSGQGALASTASSRGLQSPGSRNLRSSATSKPPAPPPR
ncbi:hypothetical protein DUNSADRAFT_12768 [Dunaliella salina]|uniref:PPM-type phosphatase domain-containing protein n=1 Tax=Dunaliella salina TaxID=3046 RepID=A0ABQ7GAM0_DUNSA|nr:hypothetical protein DUNSADRAFT_12768 [Dunaliella salina]|eukprot:KAF5831640.1 hypothetical protein DUNSADRAFT_12768 [Dunaliella salina]